ncbi:sugar 3,4-ketoisomerase [Winogradskyella immobilis]|uniref:WxcM-like domain-containing protein n=1 Tax=Winogradskyella immobilis TaxID=2816852 RepID=A0ABS8ELL2_9FLAO|nr:FdtA/QdtA family cupin domain-containing protein [Winogradskyella immobilis]MCC1484098.1 WxcM-like domain-containing protein [Winogradskyella immobilis]MCG0016190.1 FdtA/QdtA family cupin domain-containing protein [Winogradskyella immobilis]
MSVKIIQIPKVHEERGQLAVIENGALPFAIKRVYYLYDVPSDAYRGGHAHLEQESVIIALSGSFDVVIDDGKEKKSIMLNKPDKGLYISTGIWREIENFSSGAVCLVLASTEFSEADYIRDYKEFKLFKRGNV